MKFTGTLQGRLVLLFLVALVPLVGFGVFSYLQSKKSLEKLVAADFSDRALSTADKVSRNLFERYGDIVDLSENPVLASAKTPPDQKSKVLTRLVETRSPVYNVLVLTDGQGKVVASSNPAALNADASKDDWFVEGLRGDPYFSPSVRFDPLVGGPTVAFSMLVKDRDTGKELGVVSSRVDYGPLFSENLVRKEAFGRTGELMIVDPQSGKILGAKDTALVLKADLASSAAFKRAQKEPTGFLVETDLKTGKELATAWATEQGFSTYPGQHVLVFVRQETGEAFQSIHAMFRNFVIAFLVALAFLLALGLRVAGSISKPILSLVTVAENISRGDLTPVGVIDRRDEVGRLSRAMQAMVAYLTEMSDIADQLAEGNLTVTPTPRGENDAFGVAFRRMVTTLRDLVVKLRETSQQLATSAEEISVSSLSIQKGAESQAASSDETSSTLVEMAAQINAVAKNTQALAANVDETASSIQEMSTLVTRTAQSSEVLLKAVGETTSTLEEINASITNVGQRVRTVDEVSKKTVADATEGGTMLQTTIKSIGDRSQDIGKIIKVIEAIADQTNLLALNAAIEAARAGDAGKGFAVVADEVKKLAERSVKATGEIAEVIEGMQKDTHRAVDMTGRILDGILTSIEKSSVMVGEVNRLTQEQTSGATQILGVAQRISDVSRQVSTAAQEQAQGSKEILKAVTSMNSMTQQVADATVEQKKGGDMVVKAMETIANVARANLAAVEELSHASMGLAREAEGLRQQLEAFRV
ncbi:MAG TPA: methyl-accepting chemotaxis protein [Thermoanaerobaculia bacterium]|nr:methyl-accepting chemotaxis protein [Thermoanaerobaculia bacterium]